MRKLPSLHLRSLKNSLHLKKKEEQRLIPPQQVLLTELAVSTYVRGGNKRDRCRVTLCAHVTRISQSVTAFAECRIT